jgi:hypothetical protein
MKKHSDKGDDVFGSTNEAADLITHDTSIADIPGELRETEISRFFYIPTETFLASLI